MGAFRCYAGSMRLGTFATCCALQLAAAAAQEPIPLEEIFAPRSPFGVVPKLLELASDGERLTLLHSEDRAGGGNDGAARRSRRLLLLNALNGKRIPLPFPVREPGHAAFAPFGHGLLLVRQREILSLDNGAGDAKTILVSDRPFDQLCRLADGSVIAAGGNDRWILTRGSRRFSKLTLPQGAKLLAKAAQTRRYLFQIRPGPRDAAGASELVTLGWSDGRRELHFTLPAAPHVLAFASDGSAAAFATFEKGADRQEHVVPDYLSDPVSVKKVATDRPGAAPRVARVFLARFHKRVEIVPVPLVPGREAAALPLHVVSLEFEPKGRRLLLQTIDATWNRRRLLLVDRSRPKEVTLLFQEQDDKWIGPLARTAFFDTTGKAVIFTSEIDDTARVFRLPVAGSARPEALTPEGVLVDSCVRTADERILVSLAHPDPARRFLAILDPQTRRVLHPDQPPGWNESPVLAQSADRIAFLHSRLFEPPSVWTTSLHGTARARQVFDPTPDAFRDRRWIRPEFVRYRTPDKQWVHAHLFMPKGRRPDGGWPAVIFLHGTGYLQNVRDSLTAYPRNLLFHHRLAERGFVVLSPDFRGSKGYGRGFRTAVHADLGGPDRQDIVAARKFLFDKCGVHLGKIGLYGGSYGGFLTLMCLFKEPKAFACGAALRPVTDWSRYDGRYTEPRLGSPQVAGGEEIYRRTSPIWFADNLERPLLLLHGMQDTNVFVQHTIRLVERLIALGKDFDLMLYPSQKHAFEDQAAWVDQYRRIERLFERELK